MNASAPIAKPAKKPASKPRKPKATVPTVNPHKVAFRRAMLGVAGLLLVMVAGITGLAVGRGMGPVPAHAAPVAKAPAKAKHAPRPRPIRYYLACDAGLFGTCSATITTRR